MSFGDFKLSQFSFQGRSLVSEESELGIPVGGHVGKIVDMIIGLKFVGIDITSEATGVTKRFIKEEEDEHQTIFTPIPGDDVSERVDNVIILKD